MSSPFKKIKIEVTLEVNIYAWCNEYGIFPNTVVTDVKRYMEGWIEDSPPVRTGIATVVS
jgi:hypothetical protein